MKKMCLLFLLPLFLSCSKESAENETDGELRISFAMFHESDTRTRESLPDTSEFILSVKNASGETVYNGKFGDSPESIQVKPGNYTVSAVSCVFERPAFSVPQYGDEQVVVVPSGGTMSVNLVCSQLNSGVRLRILPEFLSACPDGVLFLKSTQGKLMYGYSEKRVAYFTPGPISLILSDGGVDKVLMTRTLLSREILNLTVGAVGSQSDGNNGRVSVAVDTSRYWLDDKYVIGDESGKGNSAASALTVAQISEAVGNEDVWVCGYIVGGNLTSVSASFSEPFTSRTNLLLGPRSTVSSRSSCISIHLPAGSVRDGINLVDNPHLLGRKIYLKGDVEASYFGLVGLKNTSEYKLP
ncbi:MAG: DUF4493 domain-containing protein [Bacteroidales bacterium]|nr:DUF4493 domain-containing protein [Bacteroidales bacterium]